MPLLNISTIIGQFILLKYRNLRDYIAKKYFSHWLILAFDLVISVFSTFLTCFIIKSISSQVFSFHAIEYITIIALPTSAAVFWALHTTRNVIRYSNIKDTWRLFVASIIKPLIIYFTAFLIGWVHDLSLIHVLIWGDIFTTFFSLIVCRILMVMSFDILIANVHRSKNNTIIYGIGKESLAAATRLKNNSNYNIVGYVCKDKSVIRFQLAGHKVFAISNTSDLKSITAKYNIKSILFCNYKDLQKENELLINFCINHDIKILVLPSVEELGKRNINHIRNIKIEDLLSRDEIQVNEEEIKEKVDGKTIIVTGAAGSIGSELCRQLAKYNIGKLIMVDNAETPMHNLRLELESKFPCIHSIPIIADIRFEKRMESIFKQYKPLLLFHAAAYKHVPLMEENPCESLMVNVIGTRNIANLCVRYGVSEMIMISTDKAVNPTNVMGASKRMAEMYVQGLGEALLKGSINGTTKFITTRFGNVLGSNGSVVPLFRKQIAEGGPVTVTHPDITRFFMTIPEACRLVLEASAMGKSNYIYVFDMGKSVKISDMAKRMIALSGYIPNKDILIKYTGLRPGEKLYEEVLSNKENTIPTANKKILIAKVRESNYESVKQMVENCKKLIEIGDVYESVKYMKEVVPEFISNNSEIFENIDKELGKN